MTIRIETDPSDRTSVRLSAPHAFAAGETYDPLTVECRGGLSPSTLRVLLRNPGLPGMPVVSTAGDFTRVSRFETRGTMTLLTEEMAEWCASALGGSDSDAESPRRPLAAEGRLEIYDGDMLAASARVPVVLRWMTPGGAPAAEGTSVPWDSLSADIEALAARLSALEGSDSDASVREIASEVARAEVARVVDGAPEAFDTLREIASWIGSEGDGAAALAARVAALEAAGAEANVQADWSESDPDSDAFVRNRPPIPSSPSDVGAATAAQGAKADAALSRAEAEAGFTEWTFSVAGNYGIREYYDDETEPAFWNYVLLAGGVEIGGTGSEGRLTFVDFGDYVEGLTAARTRLPTMADLAPKADKSEMSVTAGTGANADKTTIQLKAGTGATVLTAHQQLQGQFTEWTFAPAGGGGGLPPDIHLILSASGWFPATDEDYPAGTGVAKGDSSSTYLEWGYGESPFNPFTATRTMTGYVLGNQTAKPLQPQGNYYAKPSGGIPASDMANAVQTSLGLADTAVQPAGIAGLTPLYLMEAATVAGGTLTVVPYTVSTYTATSTAAAFEIAVGALPAGVTGKARDCVLVIDCTASGAAAPTVAWPSNFHPRTDTATDLAIVEAGKKAVFYISEYATGEFAVGGWQETAGGSGT